MQQGHFSSRRVNFSFCKNLAIMECCWSLSLEYSTDHTASSPTVKLIRSTAFHSTSLK
uniref:Uncharacterized protein n=1 Tax=Hyaloperonospora arabidopsidis (strain Emoy2) TaxID=559515 RepID=M4BG58_HYAAE